MMILENKFSPVAITLSLADIGINMEKVIDTTAEMGGGSINALYLPISDKDKLLAKIDDIVTEIAIANGYYCYPYMTVEESDKSFPNIFPIAYKVDFDLQIDNGDVDIQIWIEPKNTEDEQYLDESLVLENIPVKLDNDDMDYLLKVLTDVILNKMYNE